MEPNRLRPHSAGSTILRLGPTGSSVEISPVDYDPVVLLKPFGPHLAASALPSKEPSMGLQVSLSVSRLSPSCLNSFSIPFHPLWPVRNYPHLRISARGPGLSGTSTHLTRQLSGAHYEPLRHPWAPGLSLAGVRLTVPGHTKGLPVLRTLSLCTCCRHYPGAAAGRRLRSFTQPYQPSLVRRPGRPAHRPFRGLPGVHLRCGLHTRAATSSWHAIRRLQPCRYLHDCSDCFRRERVRRVGLTPTGKRRLCTAHVESRYCTLRVERPHDL